MKCPNCDSEVIIGTKKSNGLTTLKIKCTKCNRKVIKTRKSEDYNTLRKLVFEAWASNITYGADGDEFD